MVSPTGVGWKPGQGDPPKVLVGNCDSRSWLETQMDKYNFDPHKGQLQLDFKKKFQSNLKWTSWDFKVLQGYQY